MKDFRSLEQKIIQLVQESNRNTELRKKESNVGRPTGDNKLAKQGQIKTKIIDEDSEYGMARNELETAKRAIDRLNAKMGKGEGELEAWVQAKITKASDYLDTVADYIESGSVKEEVIDEKAKRIHVHHKGDVAHVKDLNGNIIASYNRREHGDNYLRRAHAHLGKVYEDSVASVSTKDSPKEQPESKKKTDKSIDKDLMEPGKIKGGKTEVDLEPTTDDRDDEGKKDADKSKVATRKANREAGVKEETMNTTKNFGLPADLIATVAEALKGNQKKIDKNHNGKIDGQDFKILRGKKKVEEEVEEIDERDAGNKAKKDAAAIATGAKNRDAQHLGSRGMKTDVADKIRGREKMSGKDRQHYGEEVEQIDELSPATMHSYQDKAADSIAHSKGSLKRKEGDRVAHAQEIKKRNKGLDLAGERLAKKNMDEEVEQIDEVSHRDYAAKGMMHPDMAKGMHVGKEGDFYAHGTGDKKYGKVVKNSGGQVHIKQTHDSYSDKKVNKLHKFKVSSSMDEETDPVFSEAELAHINAILESDDFNYANSKDHKPLSNWPKVHDVSRDD